MIPYRGPEIEAFHKGIFHKDEDQKSNGKDRNSFGESLLADDELIKRIQASRQADKFNRLFIEGNISEYGDDDSRADHALVSILGWWTCKDPEATDRIFRRSGLMRDKWEREDYRHRTINKAFSKLTEVYNGNGHDLSDIPNLDDISTNPEELITATWEDVEKEVGDIEWYWPKWIVKNGLLQEIAGYSGFGKSAVELWLLSQSFILGKDWPDGTPFNDEIGDILWAEAEAAQAININRAKDWGIPLKRIITPFSEPLTDINLLLPEHRETLWLSLRKSNVRICFTDSLSGAIKKDENKKEFADAVKDLSDIAKDCKKPIKASVHLGKRDNQHRSESRSVTLEDVRGNSGIVQYARVVWAVDTPLGGKIRRLHQIKNNISEFPDPLGFEISTSGLTFCDPPKIEKYKHEWEQLLDILLKFLRNGPQDIEAIEKESIAAGYSMRLARKAREKSNGLIASTKDNTTGKYFWSTQRRD